MNVLGILAIVEFDQLGPEVFGQEDSSVAQVNVYVFRDRARLPDFIGKGQEGLLILQG